MSEFSNELTSGMLERLALLSEELGEAQAAIGKILRRGYESKRPDGGLTNRHALENEIGDVREAVRRLCTRGDLSESNIVEARIRKGQSVKQWLHHQ